MMPERRPERLRALAAGRALRGGLERLRSRLDRCVEWLAAAADFAWERTDRAAAWQAGKLGQLGAWLEVRARDLPAWLQGRAFDQAVWANRAARQGRRRLRGLGLRIASARAAVALYGARTFRRLTHALEDASCRGRENVSHVAGLTRASVARVAGRLDWPGRRFAGVAGAAAAAMLIGLGADFYLRCGGAGCPDVGQLTVYQPGGAPRLLDRNGEHFADLAPFERIVVPIDSLPEHVPAAFIAIEDRRFWRHRGVDWRRVIGAAVHNIRASRFSHGSSTIPMQLARNVFPREIPGQERTIRRKLQEVRVARQIERRYTKHEILELYLNHIYFGGGAWGVEAASQLYFDKPANELSAAEAATLAGLPKAPTHFDPRRHPDRARARRDLVLALMEAQQLLAPEEAELARGSELAVDPDGGRDRSGIPLGAYFVDGVRELLEERLGHDLYRTGLRIHTTLDARAQRAAERELAARLGQLDGHVRRGPGELQGAVVLLEAHTGDVLALVGGRDPATSRYNRATFGRRQVGSAFKPFVFAAALAAGVPASQPLMDSPLRLPLSRTAVWEPSNYDGWYEGQVSMRRALVRSRNVPTARLALAVGIGDVARTARAAGVSEPMDETPALALGTPSVSPLTLATAYATFATLGRTPTPRLVLRVEDEAGRVLWEPPHQPPRRGLDPGVAYIVTDMLRDAVDFGTGTGVRRAGFHGVAAGKTGTTNHATDAWFVGYDPEVVGAVWIGYDQPSPLGRGATGGGFAAPVWGAIMREYYAERPLPSDWRAPEGVVRRRFDPYTGQVLQDGCHARYGTERSELFLAAHVPVAVCPRRDWWQSVWGRRGGRVLGEPYRPAPPPRGRGRGRGRTLRPRARPVA